MTQGTASISLKGKVGHFGVPKTKGKETVNGRYIYSPTVVPERQKDWNI